MYEKYTITIQKNGALKQEKQTAKYGDQIRWKNKMDTERIIRFPHGAPFHSNRELPIDPGCDSELRRVTTEKMEDFSHHIAWVSEIRSRTASPAGVASAGFAAIADRDDGDLQRGSICANCV